MLSACREPSCGRTCSDAFNIEARRRSTLSIARADLLSMPLDPRSANRMLNEATQDSIAHTASCGNEHTVGRQWKHCSGSLARQHTDAAPATSTGIAFSLFDGVGIDSSETFPNPSDSLRKALGINARRQSSNSGSAILTFGKASLPFWVFASQSGLDAKIRFFRSPGRKFRSAQL